MHHIYNTKGIILSSFGVGEANKLFYILTKDLGLIQATAQGVRNINSKNRYGLQDFSISNLSLVRGREVWRITNVSAKENLFFKLSQREILEFLAGIFTFIRQLVQGEEKNEELYNLVSNLVSFLKKEELNVQDIKGLELITKIRILHNLGYFDDKIFSWVLETGDFNQELIEKMNVEQRKAEKEINNAMEDIHL